MTADNDDMPQDNQKAAAAENRSVDDRLAAIEERLDILMRAMEPRPEDRLEHVELRVDALLTSIEALAGSNDYAAGFHPTSTGPAFGFVDSSGIGGPTRRTFSWAKNCCKNWCSITASSKGCHPNAC